MLAVSFRRVKQDQVGRLREWMREVNARVDEVRETFVQETVKREMAILIDGREGPILLYVIEADDIDQCMRVVRERPFPIDLQHREVMLSVVEGPATVEILMDIAAGT